MVLISSYRLFDGDETVALITEKAAGLTHNMTELSSSKTTSSTEEVKWVGGAWISSFCLRKYLWLSATDSNIVQYKTFTVHLFFEFCHLTRASSSKMDDLCRQLVASSIINGRTFVADLSRAPSKLALHLIDHDGGERGGHRCLSTCPLVLAKSNLLNKWLYIHIHIEPSSGH